jgi:hypothetical protein
MVAAVFRNDTLQHADDGAGINVAFFFFFSLQWKVPIRQGYCVVLRKGLLTPQAWFCQPTLPDSLMV